MFQINSRILYPLDRPKVMQLSVFVRIANVWRAEGFSGFFERCLKRVGFVDAVERKKLVARKVLTDIVGYQVIYGPFEGLKLPVKSWWGEHDVCSKILGQYEPHVIQFLESALKSSDQLLDVGAADGYFAVGVLHANFCQQVIAFEMSEAGRESIRSCAIDNGVEDRINIQGAADERRLIECFEEKESKCVLIDIEGGEYSLLSEAVLFAMRGSNVVIELHPFLIEDGYQLEDILIKRAGEIFDISFLRRGSVPIDSFSELNHLDDDTRTLIFSESRDMSMRWLCLTPKVEPMPKKI